MKTLEYLIKANSSDFVTAVTKAETIYGQALKGMADKAKQISLFKQAKDEADSTGTALVKLKTTAEQVRKALGDSGGSLQQSQQLAKAEAAISKTEACNAWPGSSRGLHAPGAGGGRCRHPQPGCRAGQDGQRDCQGQWQRERPAPAGRCPVTSGIRSQTDIQREIQQVSAAFTRLTQNPPSAWPSCPGRPRPPRPGWENARRAAGHDASQQLPDDRCRQAGGHGQCGGVAQCCAGADPQHPVHGWPV
jgi:hypothetical protein